MKIFVTIAVLGVLGLAGASSYSNDEMHEVMASCMGTMRFPCKRAIIEMCCSSSHDSDSSGGSYENECPADKGVRYFVGQIMTESRLHWDVHHCDGGHSSSHEGSSEGSSSESHEGSSERRMLRSPEGLEELDRLLHCVCPKLADNCP